MKLNYLCDKISSRITFSLISLICFVSLSFAYYAEFVQHFDPCPICIAQRIIFFAIGVVALLSALFNTKKIIKYLFSLSLLALCALMIKVSLRHLWLLNAPADQLPLSCGMPLGILYKRIPLNSFLHTILQGDAECSKVKWLIFGLQPPIAIIITTTLIICMTIYAVLKK